MVFGTSWQTAHNSFNGQRKNGVNKLGNPRILQIHFHTFRHWKATMKYHRTKDILHVMRLLGHKNVANTLIYTQLVEFGSDEYCSAVADNVGEAKKLIEAGFEYVCSHKAVDFSRCHQRINYNRSCVAKDVLLSYRCKPVCSLLRCSEVDKSSRSIGNKRIDSQKSNSHASYANGPSHN